MTHNAVMVNSSIQAVSQSPLLETKLYAPRWRPGHVSRPELVARLDQGITRKLTLVSAPAGFGKTTLLAEWLASSRGAARSVAWVSLGDGDNDPTLFWTYVVTAVKRVRPDIGERALALLRSPQPPASEAILTAVINEISADDEDVVIVLDDFHVIEAPPVHSAVAFLLEHLPPNLHIVISGRSDPPLPLARFRARGESAELRASDLRFTPAESASFLNESMGLRLTEHDIALIDARAEGWIAGLQLSALSMQGRSDVSAFASTFAGDDRYIVDYLVEEVLQRQPDELRTFLLQTSILDRLSGPLCDAVTGLRDSKSVLELLERGNFFVMPLDDKRHWYRYHQLFADVLRAHLIDEQPEAVPVLRRRAADWLASRGMAAEAIEQAIAAADHDAVARLLIANVEAFERAGHFASVARWSATLPDELVREQPRLAMIRAASAMRIEPNMQAARKYLSWTEDAVEAIERGEDPVRSNRHE